MFPRRTLSVQDEETALANSYTITVQSDSGAQTTVRVTDVDGTPQVTEVCVRAAEGSGLSTEQLPFMQVDLLLQALSPQTAALSHAVAQSQAPQTARAAATPPGLQEPAGTGQEAPVEPAAARRSASTSGPVTRRSAAAVVKQGTPSVGRPRTYRRMPPDLAEVYASVESVTAVAAHYNVPRHTAQGWIGRLRQNQAAVEADGSPLRG
jgi:hypothetical protein